MAPMARAWFRRRLVVARNPPGRWWFAIRAALCLAAPVVIGWAVGDTAAGLTATIGGFTALYGNDRPYVSRAGHLAVVAAGFAIAVTVGDWAARTPWLGVLAVSAIAMVATLMCNALAVGPPGAYMFVLACAAGTGAAAQHVPPWQIGLLVLGGGAFAWIVHMAGAVHGLHRPEKAAVASAATAVSRYLDALAGAEDTAARHAAAQALHRSWVVLVNFQPAVGSPTVRRLRAVNRELHVLFAEAMAAAAAGQPVDPQWARRAHDLASAGYRPTQTPERVPLGRPSAPRLLRQALQPRSGLLRLVARVGVAVVIAGGLASLLGVERSYWAMAAAVLVLHQGFDRRRTLRRGVERSIGTWAGLVLAGLLLAMQPTGLWLAVVLALLQFTIEMLVIPIYAVATVFITPAALLIASGGRPVADVMAVVELLLARGVDTLIGAVVAILVYLLTTRDHDIVKLSEAVAAALDAAAAAAPHLAANTVASPAALAARRDLQLRAFELQAAYATATAASHRRRDAAERLWPAVAATEDFAYRTLAECWAREQHGAAGEIDNHWTAMDLERFEAVTTTLADAVRTGRPAHGIGPLPKHGSAELAQVRDTLTGAAGND
jgi:uncharacterized membrane protein YccC